MPSIDEFKDHARQAFQSKQFKKAAKIYRDAIASYGNDPVLYSNRAQCFINLQDWQRALADTQSGLQHTPETGIKVKLLYRKGIASKNLNNHQEAVKCFQGVLDLDPSNTSAQNELESLTEQLRVKKQKQEVKTNITVEIVDELPEEFARIVDPPVEIPRPRDAANPSLVSEYSEELFGKKSFEFEEDEPKPKYVTSTDFSTLPTMHHLRGLKSLAPEKRNDAYKFVINMDNSIIEGLFSSSGVDVEFFDFFLEACSNTLSQGVDNHLVQSITQKVEVLSKCPRFQLTLTMCDATQVKEVFRLLEGYPDESSRRLKQLLGG